MSKTRPHRSADAPWYRNGLRFECQACGRCCTPPDGYVWLKHDDLRRLAAHAGLTEEAFAQKHVRRVGVCMALLAGVRTSCVFLEKGRCTVYEARPLQCRRFPFWKETLENRQAWRDLTDECPGVNRGRCWSLQEIEEVQNGLRDAKTPRGQAGDVRGLPAVPAEAISELESLYHELDERLAPLDLRCDRCGRCCRFEAEGPQLFLSLIEFAYMLSHAEVGVSRLPRGKSGACPYLVRNACTNRDGRAIGCRTYYCHAPDTDEAAALHEWALRKAQNLSRCYHLNWDYRDLSRHLHPETD